MDLVRVQASLQAAHLCLAQHLFDSADYQQPGVSQRQAEKAVCEAQEFYTTLEKEVFHGPEA
ncbi:MAG: hypothetical protein HY268_18150 [Deltaproteobacteria bacterium]|nr:hypothetical protein [Deltaproteobacteria bacterium]